MTCPIEHDDWCIKTNPEYRELHWDMYHVRRKFSKEAWKLPEWESFMGFHLYKEYVRIVRYIKNNKRNSYVKQWQNSYNRYDTATIKMIGNAVEKKMALKEDIIAAALHPKRLQHILDTFGTIEAWEATIGA